MSFFDDGDEPRTAIRSPQPPPRRQPARARGGRADDRTLLLRRAGAAAIVLIVLIALVLGIKAILHHQALQGLKNYNASVNTLVGEEQNGVRIPFFQSIDNAFNSSNPQEVPTTLQQYISQEATYYHQAEALSVPAQMVGAQRWFVEALGFRYQALQGIAADIRDALGANSGQSNAINLIAGQMESLLTSDVIYAERVKPLIEQALASAGISGQTTDASVFLPDVGWLQPQLVATRILGYVPSSLGGSTSAGTPGHLLAAVSVQAASGTSTALSNSGLNTFAYTPAGITFVLNVQNSGTVIEHAVATKISFTKSGLDTACLTSTATIAETKPGLSYNSAIVFAPSSCTNLSAFFNVPLRMTAEVVPLPGETNKSNNYLSYLVEFTH